MKRSIIASGILVSAFLFGCKHKPAKDNLPPQGMYAAQLQMQGQVLEFSFVLQHHPATFTLLNGGEEFVIDSFILTKDSLRVPMHIFDTELEAVWHAADSSFSGVWQKKYLSENASLPFVAQKTNTASANVENETTAAQLKPRYSVYFESMLADSTVSVAEFSQQGQHLSGTILTTTGDYRYLTGYVHDNELKLSTFDGEHAFVFTGTVAENGQITGDFYSGQTWHETWEAYPNSEAHLPDPGKLTQLKEGYETISFSARTLDGSKFNLQHKNLEGKAVIVQLMGSWCPNCMDETAFLSNWYNHKKPENLELISLAFEKKDDFWYAKTRLHKLKDKYKIKYPLLVGGLYDKKIAGEKIPELTEIIAYPTLIFMDSTHKVTYIHTGFTGPGTGQHYENWKLEFEKEVNRILP
ncbi:redoxin domain-containing protein [bacterium]|nr:redoxin domain-containing protein [bacterium]